MENIYLVEPSFLYEDIQIRLPYSTGLIWSHCKTNKIIEKNYKLSDILFVRDRIDKFVDNIYNPSVIGFSCFVWNWAFNNEVAKVIKEKYPDCVIVYGGQHQPSTDRLKHEKDFFKKHSYVNILVHGEGELTFEQILLENLKEKNWSKVTGITYQTNNYKFVTTLSTPRITDIDSMPSPYLDGTFNNLIEKYKDKNFRFTCTIEGVRGCPYRCTFCEIGSLYFQKLQRQSFNKLKRRNITLKKISNLKINSYDYMFFQGSSNFSKMININLNYFSVKNQRNIEIFTENEVILIDLLARQINFVSLNNIRVKKFKPISTTNRMIFQIKDILKKKPQHACSYESGLEVLKILGI